ncbi:MAG TPA: cell division protein FtsL [Bacillota bacterium]|nr:cell division protein FtsL [Bacillota bacterium]
MNTNNARKWQQSYSEQHSNHTYDAREKQVKVKVQKSWITKGEKLLYSMICFVVLIAGYYIVSYSSSTDTVNRDVQTIEAEIEQQIVVNEGLEFEIKELSKPERITQIAKEHGLKIEDGEIKHAKALNSN